MHPYTCLLSFLSLAYAAAASSELAVHEVAGLSNFLVENIAIRQNGQLLVTISAPAATLWQIDPLSLRPAVLAVHFPLVSGSYGITELQSDLFYVTTGNFSIQTRQAVPNSFQLFEVNMTNYQERPDGTVSLPAQLRKVATFEDAIILNGLTHVDGQPEYVLAADSYAGVIWRADIATGNVTVAIKDVSMSPSAGRAAGINGLKYQNGYLFYTNTGENAYYRVPIFPNATASSEPELIANVTKGDDLILDDQGAAYVCQQANTLSRIALNGTLETIAGTMNSNSSSLLGPTAVAWGRLPADQHSLYISTNGGQSAKPVNGSQGVSRIDLGSVVSQSASGTSTAPNNVQTGGSTALYRLNGNSSRCLALSLSFLFFIQTLVL